MLNWNNSRFDITIVGAGPSGSILAYELANRGLRVLVLEKERLPRSKVCAGGITVRASSLMPFDFSEVVENVIYGSRLSYNLQLKRVRSYDKPLAYMVMREKFDFHLVKKAREVGATVVEGVEVRRVEVQDDRVLVITGDGAFPTPLLVGADGANSVVVRSLGWRDRFEYGLCLSSHIPSNREKIKEWDKLMGLDMGIPGGYGWVFPKKDYMNVGVGSSFREARKLKSYLARLVQTYELGLLDERNIRGHLMPLRKPDKPLSFKRVLLVGDAAGMIDPLSGEGIYYGLKSSYLALPVILNFVEGKAPDLREYDSAVDREIMPELKIARTVQKLNSVTPRVFFFFLRRNGRFWRAFCRMLRGEKTYVGLKRSVPLPLRWIFRLF